MFSMILATALMGQYTATIATTRHHSYTAEVAPDTYVVEQTSRVITDTVPTAIPERFPTSDAPAKVVKKKLARKVPTTLATQPKAQPQVQYQQPVYWQWNPAPVYYQQPQVYYQQPYSYTRQGPRLFGGLFSPRRQAVCVGGTCY